MDHDDKEAKITDEEIFHNRQKLNEVENNPNIERFENPNIEEMRRIIDKTKNRDSDEIHSYVYLSKRPESLEEAELYEMIAELSSEWGIYIVYDYLVIFDDYEKFEENTCNCEKDRCCEKHKTHSMPHKNCIMR